MRDNNASTRTMAVEPMEPSQLMLRVLAVVLAVVPLSLLLTAAAWSPLRSSSLLEHSSNSRQVTSAPAPVFSQAGPRTAPLRIPSAE